MPKEGAEAMKIALLTIVSSDSAATWEHFARQSDKHFMPGADRHWFILSDVDLTIPQTANVTVVQLNTREFEGIHLRRHHWCLELKERLEQFDYTYFLPVFADFQREVSTDFLPDHSTHLVVVQHPGNVNVAADRWPLERNPRSQAFVQFGEGFQYVTSEIYGARTGTFLDMSQAITTAIDIDHANGLVARRHFESYLNRYIINHPCTLRHAGYCYPEYWDLGVPKVVQMSNGGLSDGRRQWRGYQPAESGEEVVVEIAGDLGSQITQYAVARSVAEQKECQLYLDTRSFDNDPQYSYGLGALNIHAAIASHDTLPPRANHSIKRWFDRRWGQRYKTVDPRCIDIAGNSCEHSGKLFLSGQQPSLPDVPFAGLEAIRSELAAELSSTIELSQRAGEMLNRITTQRSIAVHVPRNGDSRGRWSPAGASPLPAIYYQRAIDELLHQVSGNSSLCFFTDDVAWVESNIEVGVPHQFVNLEDFLQPHEELELMRACRDKILSFESLSWWAAWLSGRAQGAVVAPWPESNLLEDTRDNWSELGWIWMDYRKESPQRADSRGISRAA